MDEKKENMTIYHIYKRMVKLTKENITPCPELEEVSVQFYKGKAKKAKKSVHECAYRYTLHLRLLGYSRFEYRYRLKKILCPIILKMME